jgi:hypothetical protein
MRPYQLLFDISIQHIYYADGICRDLALEADDGALRDIGRAGLLLRRTVDGLALWIAPEQMEQLRERVADAGNALTLGFRAYCADPHFAEYTLPAARAGQLLWFDSRKAGLDQSGRNMLHATPFVSEQSLVTPDATQLARLLGGARAPRLPIALVQIVLTNDANGLCADGQDPALRRFGLRFDAAQAHWKYLLLGALGGKPAYITDLDEAVTFRRLDQQVALDGRHKAAVFLSERAIAMRDIPLRRFQLKEAATFGEKVLIKRMPNARVGTGQREVVDGHAVLVSEIFINQ